MVKLAQQFNAAGVKGRQDKAPRKGWTYAEQRAYVRGRFEKPVPFPCAIYNHKVEQVMRAIVVCGLENDFSVLTSTSPRTVSLQYNYPPETVFKIGKVKGDTATLFPSANTALAILGFNGAAVLHWLGAQRIVDELTGVEYLTIENDGEFIYTTAGVLQRAARDCVLNRDAVLAFYNGTKPQQGSKHHARKHH